MGGTDANIIRIAGGDFPALWHEHRLIAIFNKSAIVDFVTMERHVQVGTIALKKRGGGGKSKFEYKCMCKSTAESLRVRS